MSDFLLEPCEIEPERPERRPVRLVSTGLAPTAAIPAGRRTAETPPCYVPCEACGAVVLVGETLAGLRVALDIGVQRYAPVWESKAAHPALHQSRGYPVHVCRGDLTGAHARSAKQ